MDRDCIVLMKTYLPLTLYESDIQEIEKILTERGNGCQKVEIFYRYRKEYENTARRDFELNSVTWKLHDITEIAGLEDGQSKLRNLTIIGYDPQIKILLDNREVKIESRLEKADMNKANLAYNLMVRVDDILSERSSKWNLVYDRWWKHIPVVILSIIPFLAVLLMKSQSNVPFTVFDFMEITAAGVLSVGILTLWGGMIYLYVKNSCIKIIKGTRPTSMSELMRKNKDVYVYFALREGIIVLAGVIVGVVIGHFLSRR